MHAARNIALCNKDCICLFVCPTGATDTETGQIDFSRCLEGCRSCVDACPSHAISLVPSDYPSPQEKKKSIRDNLLALAKSKTQQEKIAQGIAKTTDNPITKQLAQAIAMTSRISSEDCMREGGFMLPQSQEVRVLLQALRESAQQEDYPKEVVERLLVLIS